MTVYKAQIVDADGKNPTFGDHCTVTRPVTGLTSSPDQVIAKAWLTVKLNLTDADVDAKLQLEITTTLTADGQITDDGTGDTAGEVQFVVSGTDYDDLSPDVSYWFDIQLLLNDGVISTLERGRVKWEAEVTEATA